MIKNFILTFSLLSFCLSSRAQLTYNYRVVQDSFYTPWEIIWGNDDHIWFTEGSGFICRMDPESGHTDTLYNEPDTHVHAEGGMLGMAMHPQFPVQPYIYVSYVFVDVPTHIDRMRIVRYSWNGSQLQNRLVIMDSMPGFIQHCGSRLLIKDDKLFVTIGDLTASDTAQSLNAPMGKVLRINLDGSIPPDNPYPGSPIWTLGNRNAQGLAWVGNRLYSSEHGAATDDEINIIEKGRNYGWPAVEGYCNLFLEQVFCTANNVKEPIFIWTPTIAPSGMEYYDKPLYPSLQGSLLLATLKAQQLHKLTLDTTNQQILSDSVIVINGFSGYRLRDVCFSPQGRVFISTSNSPLGAVPWPPVPPQNRLDRIIEIFPDTSFNSVPVTVSNNAVPLYPNPVKDVLLVTGMDHKVWSYTISDMAGRVIRKEEKRSNAEIDVRKLAQGVYVLKCYTADGNFITNRFLKY